MIRPNWTTIIQLINTETSTWDRDLVYYLVDESTADRIFAIPISGSGQKDRLVWKHEGSGEYSVKSGYRALNTDYLRDSTYRSSFGEDYKVFYNTLWSLNILGKIKIHISTLVNNLVPHFGNLARRTFCAAVSCPLCKEELEDSDHLLWYCSILQRVWALLTVQIPSFEDSVGHILRFVKMFSAADEQQKQIIVISIWSLWFHRNKLVHEGANFSMQEMLGFIRGYVHNICLNFMSLCSSPRPLIKEIWRPPDPGVIKLNFDASFLKEEKLAVTAVLARNFTGKIVGAETYLFNDVTDAFVAEARACKRALIFASRMYFRRLVVEGDSLTEISYLAVTRLINEAAYTLALEGRRRNIYGDWLTGVPESVQLAALQDRLAWDRRS
ncbi:hypothetical protein Godav_025025 [Gossypium davidsonii]|uniref:Reverse transcriptase zinc-binding domain-containing protein n=1 Tax=Gossypium davidsonii TaxID=34287 RepID=A0A7J8TK76_GOSDV|nr:hypothetical protein [Gossypium davidsonii]